MHETLGVQYDVAALKRQLEREDLAHRPAGLWRYRELLPVVDPCIGYLGHPFKNKPFETEKDRHPCLQTQTGCVQSDVVTSIRMLER